MAAQRTSFEKLQRDRAKKAKQAAKREKRLDKTPEEAGEEELMAPSEPGTELSAAELLARSRRSTASSRRRRSASRTSRSRRRTSWPASPSTEPSSAGLAGDSYAGADGLTTSVTISIWGTASYDRRCTSAVARARSTGGTACGSRQYT